MAASQEQMNVEKEERDENNIIEPKVFQQENGTLVFTKQKKESSVNKRTKKSMRKAEVVYVEPILPSYMQNIDQI